MLLILTNMICVVAILVIVFQISGRSNQLIAQNQDLICAQFKLNQVEHALDVRNARDEQFFDLVRQLIVAQTPQQRQAIIQQLGNLAGNPPPTTPGNSPSAASQAPAAGSQPGPAPRTTSPSPTTVPGHPTTTKAPGVNIPLPGVSIPGVINIPPVTVKLLAAASGTTTTSVPCQP